MRSFTQLFIFIGIIITLLVACSSKETYLTRIDVQLVNQDESLQEESMIIDIVTLDSIESLFQEIEWDKEIQEENARKEDILLTVFYSEDENYKETLHLYRLWFETDNTITIIRSDNKEPYGKLNEENSIKLKNLLLIQY